MTKLNLGVVSLDVTSIGHALSAPRSTVAEKAFVRYIGFVKHPTIVGEAKDESTSE